MHFNKKNTLIKRLLLNFRQKTKAFTLAEVLITLAIIGVVAAMVIPTVIQNTQNQELVVSAKKTYSALMQSKKLMQAESMNYGDIFISGESNAQSLDKLSAYLNVTKKCGNTTNGCWDYSVKYPSAQNDGYGNYNATVKLSGSSAILADGTKIIVRNASKGPNCGVTTWVNYAKDSDGNYVLDGSGKVQVSSTVNAQFCGDLFIDTNGAKGPNTFGKDVFYILFFPTSFSQHSYTAVYGNLTNILINGIIK